MGQADLPGHAVRTVHAASHRSLLDRGRHGPGGARLPAHLRGHPVRGGADHQDGRGPCPREPGVGRLRDFPRETPSADPRGAGGCRGDCYDPPDSLGGKRFAALRPRRPGGRILSSSATRFFISGHSGRLCHDDRDRPPASYSHSAIMTQRRLILRALEERLVPTVGDLLHTLTPPTDAALAGTSVAASIQYAVVGAIGTNVN